MSVEFVEVVVSGRVQGVGYREFTRQMAERLGLAGWVRNLRDGTVEARLVGESDALETMLAAMRRGPSHGRVSQLRIVARGEAKTESGFRIEATR